jgi:AcrR family transcriptional regulator
LNRDRVLQAAVALADKVGIEAFSMRRLAQELNVVPMALYKYLSNKEELLDAMVEVIVGEIRPPVCDTDWKSAVRQKVLSIESRISKTPTVLNHVHSLIVACPSEGVVTPS